MRALPQDTGSPRDGGGADTQADDKMAGNRCSKERVGITLLVIVVLACIITPIVYLVQQPDKRQDGPKTLPTPAPIPAIPAELHQRIDCLPEARGEFIKLTKEECERRNCVFVQEQSNQSCVYPNNSEYGYSVVLESTTSSATQYYLRKRGKSPFSSPDFKEPVVIVEERGDNLLRIKVIFFGGGGCLEGGGAKLVKKLIYFFSLYFVYLRLN